MKALRVERGAVVSFVGGGGKTSAMFRLASEMSAQGFRVVTTTTTHIAEDQVQLAPASISPGRIDLLKEHLDRYNHCLIVASPDGKGRMTGVPPEMIQSLKERPDVDAVLVEADGSRSLPFKAPAGHEPVVPSTTTILVPVAGLDSMGRPLDEKYVHRAEIAASLARQPIGSPVTAETIARVLPHPAGGAKGLPAGARLVPLLNKADREDAPAHGRQIAEMLMENPAVDCVIIGSMLHDPPALETWVPVAGILLADAEPKPDGAAGSKTPWSFANDAVRAATAALAAGLDPVIAVLGYEAEIVSQALKGLPLILVTNPVSGAERSISVQLAMSLLPQRTGAVMFLPVGSPPTTEETIRKIIAAHRRSLAPVCLPAVEGQDAGPVLFDRDLFGELRELQGDEDERALLEKHRVSITIVPISGS